MRILRAILFAAVLPLSSGLAGCGTFWDGANNLSDKFSDAMHDFNPFGTGKKPLPGERRPVFPEGVPGVQQGIPPDLMRHNPQAAEVPEQVPGVAQPPAAEPAEPNRPAAARSQAPKKTVRRARSTTAIEPEPTDPPEDGVWPPPPGR
jgi:hypothetical protein